MNGLEWGQLALYFLLLVALTPPLGAYMARVFTNEKTWLTPVLRPIENLIYRLGGVDPAREMDWKAYAAAVIVFNAAGFVVVFLLQLVQGRLPLNPEQLPGVDPLLAFNTATSFMTNTNWQAYSGENTLSYLTQMLGLTAQNFLSGATGVAVLIAMTRGLARRQANSIGSFWVDLVRGVLYVFLPLSFVFALILVSQGVIQNVNAYVQATTLAGGAQLLPQGPVASQEAIKMLGTNGGGFFNANSAHPYENPTPLANFLEVLAILLAPAALTYTYGKLIGSTRQGWVIISAMLVLLLAAALGMLWSEGGLGQLSGAMEGKEVRFGIGSSVLWSAVTTAASSGSINAAISSLAPAASGIALLNMLLGEIIFGGVGSGMYGMLMFVVLTVFIAGQMVGRTPEYLGKKIESREVKMAILAIVLPSAAVLIFGAVAAVTPAGLASRSSSGPHGLTEIIYAFASAANNNGSAFAGLNANTPFYNVLTALAMWIGRFGVIIPALAIAGSMAAKKAAPPSPGTFPTDGLLFGVLLIAVVYVVGALTFFPVLSLGPIVEQMLMLSGRTF